MISKRKMIAGLVFTCVFVVVVFWVLSFAVPTEAANTQERVTEEFSEQQVDFDVQTMLKEGTKAELSEEQRAWITEKEAEVKQIGEESGGSMAALLCNQRAEEEETTITFIVEGLEEVVPAIAYEGENYSITVPKEGWVNVTRGVWRSDINNQVQISVVDYTGENSNSVRENLSDSGYIEIEQNHMSVEDSNGCVWNVRLFTKGEKVVGVFYNYPKEAVEGFGSRLSVIVDTFEWR